MITGEVVLPGAPPAISKLGETSKMRGMNKVDGESESGMMLCEDASVLELFNRGRKAVETPLQEEVSRYYLNHELRRHDSL